MGSASVAMAVRIVVLLGGLASGSRAESDSTRAHAYLASRAHAYLASRAIYRAVVADTVAWHGTTGNGCVAFLATLLRNVGVAIPDQRLRPDDPWSNPARVTFAFSALLIERGWHRVTDLAAGDILFTADGPDHAMLFHGWAKRRTQLAIVSDNQGYRVRRALAGTHSQTPFAYALRAPQSRTPTFNDVVLALLPEFTAHTSSYAWPAPAKTHGVLRDIVHRGQTLARASRPASSHCVGITFETFWRAYVRWRRYAPMPLSVAQANLFRTTWFVPTVGGRGSAAALPDWGLGVRVDSKQAQPGDFVQFWLGHGGGHSAIFLGWEHDHAGAVTGIFYWSSQPWTQGIAASYSAVGPGADDVNINAIYVARGQ